jgi:hypothetical protein
MRRLSSTRFSVGVFRASIVNSSGSDSKKPIWIRSLSSECSRRWGLEVARREIKSDRTIRPIIIDRIYCLIAFIDFNLEPAWVIVEQQ